GYRALYRSLKNEPSRSDSLYRYLTQVISTVPADPVIGTLLATASISNNPVFDYAQVAALYDQLDTNRISAEDHELLKTGLAGLQAYQAGDHFPDFTIEDENAVLQRISNFKGKYVYVDFWASWCGPCRKKHPALAEFAQQYRGDNFEVVSISIDEDREKWLVATREDELTWVSLFDQAAAYTEELKIVAIPVSYLLDQEGKILRKNVAVADLPSLIAK
ncbi:MAG: TlpA disulfide reductase family protein, partial [Bacteroidota bacterium]